MEFSSILLILPSYVKKIVPILIEQSSKRYYLTMEWISEYIFGIVLYNMSFSEPRALTLSLSLFAEASRKYFRVQAYLTMNYLFDDKLIFVKCISLKV